MKIRVFRGTLRRLNGAGSSKQGSRVLFTELAPTPIQFISCDVHVSVCVFVTLW